MSKNFGEIEAYLEGFSGVIKLSAYGETTFFYNPDHTLKRGTYFATLKEKDGANDKASALYREGVFRLNMGLPKPDYIALFGPTPARPSKGKAIDGNWAFDELNVLTPHPIYGWMAWVSILNPDEVQFQNCIPLLESAYQKAQSAFKKRTKK